MPQNVLEPNQVFGNEYCGGANYTELTSQGIWGWADTQCNRRAPIMCRDARKPPPAVRLLRAVLGPQRLVQSASCQMSAEG